jgi:hypothetical protein
MKLCVMATKENKMHIYRENISVSDKVTQVSDVALGSLVFHASTKSEFKNFIVSINVKHN